MKVALGLPSPVGVAPPAGGVGGCGPPAGGVIGVAPPVGGGGPPVGGVIAGELPVPPPPKRMDLIFNDSSVGAIVRFGSPKEVMSGFIIL